MNVSLEPVIIAARFSDRKQYGGVSIKVQIAACKRYCSTNGYKIIGKHVVEAESAKGSNTGRIIELIKFCREYKGKVKYLIVYRLDRFARDVGSHYYLKTELLKMGIALRSATEPIDETPIGEFMETILAGSAQFQNSVKRENVISAMTTKLRSGIWQWQAPVGYINQKNKLGKSDVPKTDEGCGHRITWIFEQFATGSVTITELSKELKKKPTYNHKRKKINFTPQLIHKILNNKFYIKIMQPKGWEEEFMGDHDPLTDTETFNKCQAILHPDEQKTTRSSINLDFPLRDKLLCGCCNKKMTAAWCKGNTQKYPLYYCSNSKCPNKGKKSVHKNDFENEFMDYLKAVKPDEKEFKDFRETLIKRYEQRQAEFETTSDKLRGNLESLMEEKARVVKMGKKGALDPEEVKEELAPIKLQINEVTSALNESHEEEFKVEYLLNFAENFFRTLPQFWLHIDPQAKIKLQRVLFPNGIVYSYPGFSNSKLSRKFKLIKDIASSTSSNVTPRGIEPRFLG